MRTTRKLPDGTETKSEDDYVNTWVSMAEQLERKLGATCAQCNPGFVMRSKGNSNSLRLDMYWANKILSL